MNITLKGSPVIVPKIIGVGRNYTAHIREMQARPTGEPVLFIKPATSLCALTAPVNIPKNMGAVHHEVELAVLIGNGGKNIPEEDAMSHVAGYGLALDLTLRDLQSVAKEKGLPWATAKGFDGACPVVPQFTPAEKVEDPHNLEIELSVNDSLRQKGNTRQMIFRLPFLIHFISRRFTLQNGDIILTGTPAGVGPLQSGDRIRARLQHIARVSTQAV